MITATYHEITRCVIITSPWWWINVAAENFTRAAEIVRRLGVAHSSGWSRYGHTWIATFKEE